MGIDCIFSRAIACSVNPIVNPTFLKLQIFLEHIL